MDGSPTNKVRGDAGSACNIKFKGVLKLFLYSRDKRAFTGAALGQNRDVFAFFN
jgi:hypothetical protein